MQGGTDSGPGDRMSGPAGEYMVVEYTTVLYPAGNGIHLRGTPTLGTGSPPGTKVGMEVKHNVFAHSDQWAGIFNGVLSPGAMLQNAIGLTASENTYGLNTFGDRRSCDFDGDGTPDSLIATGITWWYASSQLGGRGVYFDTSTTRVADLTLRDVDGDGRCDITDHGVVHLSNGTGILRSYNPYGSPIAAARDGGGRPPPVRTPKTPGAPDPAPAH